jgi:hypothetical protein
MSVCCPFCARKFGVLVRTRKRCAECKVKACSACCKVFRLTVLGWTEPRRVCPKCFARIDDQLRATTASAAQYAADREASTILQMDGDVADASHRDADGDERGDDGAAASLAGAHETDDKHCARCAKPFGFLRRRLECCNCHDWVCGACTGVYHFRALQWPAPKRCCFSCSEELAALAARLSVRPPTVVSAIPAAVTAPAVSPVVSPAVSLAVSVSPAAVVAATPDVVSLVDRSQLPQDLLSCSGGCGLPIDNAAIESAGRMWHNACFACVVCKRNLATDEFFLTDQLVPICHPCDRSSSC